jgi:ABC-type polysaccharide/polyol phosphate export permease
LSLGTPEHGPRSAEGLFPFERRLLRFRGLVATLTRRELAARYRGSLLGFFWSLVNPLLLLAVYTLVFELVFRQRFGEVRPYAVFLVCGLFPWTFLSTALLEGTVSLSTNAGLLRKAVFPAEVLPMVSTLASLVHFLLALPVVLLALGAARAAGFAVGGWTVLLLPLPVVLQLVFCGGLALALAALAVHFKDVRDLLQNLLTLGFFLTPVLYPLEAVRHVRGLSGVIAANPATPFLRLYQELLFHGRLPAASLWLQAAGLALLAWAAGTWLFARLSPTLVEAV